ncbi:hypothetical protein [Mycolicibacterium moriokaense]|uniref:hypothetical protein n=1 Tax=Mycolicibacterium moriokaense TaxID=39691 RepID=UPI0015E8DDB4|nr:hypothetical protein [Mycolicibacterium moriokaense]
MEGTRRRDRGAVGAGIADPAGGRQYFAGGVVANWAAGLGTAPEDAALNPTDGSVTSG